MEGVANISIIMTWFWLVIGSSMLTTIAMMFASVKYGKTILDTFLLSVLISWLILLWLIL